MSRADEFRKRNSKLNSLNSQQAAETNLKLLKIIMDLMGRLNKLEAQMKDLFPKARIAEWRSLATMRLLSEKGIVLEEEVIAKGNQLMIEDFDQSSATDDVQRGLVSCEGPAADGMYAIVNLKVFKDGQEIEHEEIPRSKIQIGAIEQFPELDDAVRGMNIGETKSFGLKLMNQTDEGRVTLISLRKPKIEPAKEGADEQKQEGSNQ